MVKLLKTPNSNKMLHKSLYFSKKYIALIFIICFLAMNIFSAYVVSTETNKQNEIAKAKEKYGNYDYVKYVASYKDLQKIKKDKDIDKYVSVLLEDTTIDNRSVVMEWINEDELKYTDIKLNDGTFPNDSNEIAIENWYLVQLGIEADNCIGKKIEVLDTTTGTHNEKTISGVITTSTSDTQMEKALEGIPIILGNISTYNKKVDDDTFFNIYVILKNHRNAQSIVDKQQNNETFCEINGVLYYYRGYAESAVYDTLFKNVIFLLTVSILLVFICIAIKTVIELCMLKWSEQISIFKILGISVKKIKFCVIKIFIKTILLAGICGILSGIELVNLVNYLSMKKYTNVEDISISIPYTLEFGMLCIIIILAYFQLSGKFEKLQESTAYNCINYWKQSLRIKNRHYDKLFSSKSNWTIKIAIRNCFFHKGRKIILMICIALSIMVISILNVQVQAVSPQSDNNDSFNYKIRIEKNGFSDQTGYINKNLKEVYNSISKYLSDEDIVMNYTEYRVSSKFKLGKKYLTKEYKRNLKNNVITRNQLMDGRSYVEQPALIMAYSDDMLKELKKSGKCEIDSLGDNEAIIVNRTINRNHTFSAELIPPIGEKYVNLAYGSGTSKIKVVAASTDSLVYPEYDGNYLLFIINETTYNKYYNQSEIYDFYFNTDDETVIKNIEQRIAGTEFFKLDNLKNERINQESNRHQFIILYCISFITLIMCVFANIIMLNYFETDVRKQEYSLLILLGIPYKKLKKIIIVEVGIIFTGGLLLGRLLSMFMVEYLYNNMIVASNNIEKYVVIMSTVLMIICMIISIKYMWNRVKNICSISEAGIN